MIRFLKQNFIILLILLVLVVCIQYLLLQPVLKMGFLWDDWFTLDFFRILGPNPLSKISYILMLYGPHYIYPYWIGMLVNIFGWQDPTILREVNIGLKIIETLVMYPLVLLIFKRKLLAFLAVLILAMHYSATGALELVITGIDYSVGFFLFLFLAVYYHVVKNKILNFKWLGLLFLSLTATIFSEPTRSFPVLILPFLIEMFVLVYDHSKSSIKKSFFRLLTLVPIFFMMAVAFNYAIFNGGKLSSGLTSLNLLPLLLQGNWHFTLHPISSLSNLFLPPEYLSKVFGSETFNPNNLFINYLSFLISKPFMFFGILTYLFSFFIKPSWLSRWKFILITLVLNFILEIAVFFIYNLRSGIDADSGTVANYQNSSELAGMYTIFIGSFLLILNFWGIYGWWKGGRRNNILWAFWSGLTFAFIFLVLTRLEQNWIFAYKAIHRYITTASLGASLCLASFLTLFYDKITTQTSRLSRYFGGFLIFLGLIVFYNISNQQISNLFNSELVQGRSAEAQEMMHKKFIRIFSKYKYDDSKSSLFYFDVSGESSTDGLFFSESFQSNFMYWMHIRTPKLVEGCIQDTGGTVEDLKKLVKVKNGVKGIEYRAYCIHPNDGTHEVVYPTDGTHESPVQTFYMPENFYYFRVKNREFIDTRDEVLKELGFDN